MPTRSDYTAVTLEGDLIAPGLLDRIATGIDLDGAKPAHYGAVGRRSVADEAERAWDYLKTAWFDLRETIPASDRPSDPTGTARRSWIEPLFAELGFGRLATTGGGIASDDGQKRFAISHQWTHVPIHIDDWGTGLEDRHAGRPAPHSLVQECLNTTDKHLWGIVTNGRQVRLLRDSTAIAGTAYVEFDLETIFDNELVNEFILLYRLLHVSRFAVDDGAPPSACWLEKWRTTAIQAGVRALDQMKTGVRDAITLLGTGYLSHPANGHLIGSLDSEQFHRALLRLTYRLLFLFVAEDKELLHPYDADEKAKERYRKYYSSARLRAHARRRRGTTHGDLYQGLKLVLDALGSEEGQPKLALPGLGGIFDHTETDEILDGLRLSNEYLLRAVRALSVVRDRKTRRNRVIDYRHLDAEELGSVYESLLELVPKYSVAERRFELVELAGNQRKTTGSYYTPSNLIERLLDTTIDPVIDAAVKRGEERGGAEPAQAIEKELLGLTVCDPACGSGHFLVAAARRIAKRLAAVREQNPEPTPKAVKAALREVVGKCIYGVDINPMAVELAKVALWMEALEPGKALGFLDAHVKCGNSLIGAYPALMAKGIPDEAWDPIEGDDKATARKLKKRNKDERTKREHGGERLSGFFELEAGVTHSNAALAKRISAILAAPADGLGDVRRQAREYERFQESPEYRKERSLADMWCAVFFWPKEAGESQELAPTDGTYWELEDAGFDSLVGQAIARHAAEIGAANRFFHWHLEFPEVFRTGSGTNANSSAGWVGGFDAVVGNPPWERIKLQEQEFFATRDAAIAEAPNAAARKRLIAQLEELSPRLYASFQAAKRESSGSAHFLKVSGRFPFTATGDINTYSVFAETDRTITGPRGRTGVIVPTGIATDATTQRFFRDLVETRALAALYDFENAAPVFADVHRSFKFCLLSMAGSAASEEEARFGFFLHDPAELDDAGKTFNLSPDEILLLNPNTGTCPVFRSRRDAEITLAVYRRLPVLVRNKGADPSTWKISYHSRLFHMAEDSHLFRTSRELLEGNWEDCDRFFGKDPERMLPLYEGKMLHHFDNHWATYEPGGRTRDISIHEKEDPSVVVRPRYWVSEQAIDTGNRDSRGNPVLEPGVSERLRAKGWHREWLLGMRKVCRATDERTLICFLFPKGAVGDSTTLMFPLIDSGHGGLYAALSSFVLDYILRQKIGGTNIGPYQLNQLPVPDRKQMLAHESFLYGRVLELVFSSYDMRPFAVDMGDEGRAPFVWDEERRFFMRAELDALFFHLYGIERDDVDYIMETFPIVKRKDIAKFGSYRTKELILEIYDQMAAAGVSAENPPVDGENFFSRLTPPPGQGPRHPARQQ
ncbi:Eco57I restriction-modification methylase domain-containing protein [Glycomyces arizonensis]|uniref:Eco57I restriction-modification methylase domain-containing protein n=1 Tax=Glycomyces arizonensis TaxID=256035 RepID=UPI00040B4AA9|nr:N-6 DNA methylase [Glycomyces arizonensis]